MTKSIILALITAIATAASTPSFNDSAYLAKSAADKLT